MISVVLATYNEAKNIERCLEAVQAWADEIIIVDGSSQDQTRKIAKSFGAQVIKTTNKPNFHINKQMAIDAAQGDLILQLDADEVVDQTLVKFIQQLHKQLQKYPEQIKVAAWWVKRKNLFFNKWLKKGGQYPDPVIRLFLKDQAYLPQEDVHEQMHVKGSIGSAQGHLLHFANPKFADYWRKFNTYTNFKAQQLFSAKTKINLVNSLNYVLIKPTLTFLKLFIRHKGFVDGVAGFLFALFSGLHHLVAYLKLWELKWEVTKEND